MVCAGDGPLEQWAAQLAKRAALVRNTMSAGIGGFA